MKMTNEEYFRDYRRIHLNPDFVTDLKPEMEQAWSEAFYRVWKGNPGNEAKAYD